MEEGHYLTWLNLIDGEEQQYSVYYNGELDDVFEDDTVEVTGLPLIQQQACLHPRYSQMNWYQAADRLLLLYHPQKHHPDMVIS